MVKHCAQNVYLNLQTHISLNSESGVRPYTDGELPIMDRVDDGLYVITGHYRNGFIVPCYWS